MIPIRPRHVLAILAGLLLAQEAPAQSRRWYEHNFFMCSVPGQRKLYQTAIQPIPRDSEERVYFARAFDDYVRGRYPDTQRGVGSGSCSVGDTHAEVEEQFRRSVSGSRYAPENIVRTGWIYRHGGTGQTSTSRTSPSRPQRPSSSTGRAVQPRQTTPRAQTTATQAGGGSRIPVRTPSREELRSPLA